jgi:hypothetical protein
MNAATTRSIIAAAGLAAMGLVAWPHQAMPPSAQQGVPTVRRDVALVDDTILGPKTTFDTTLTDSVWGSLRFRRFHLLQPSQVAENSRRLAASATGTRALIRVPSLMCSVC